MGEGTNKLKDRYPLIFVWMQEIMYAKQIHWLEVNRH